MSKKEEIKSSKGIRHASPIPQGIRAGGFIFLSALRGADPETQQIETADMRKQCRQLFENLKTILTEAGVTLAEVVKVGVYMKDLADRPVFNEVWTEYFGQNPPARFAVQVVDLGAPGDQTRILFDVVALAG